MSQAASALGSISTTLCTLSSCLSTEYRAPLEILGHSLAVLCLPLPPVLLHSVLLWLEFQVLVAFSSVDGTRLWSRAFPLPSGTSYKESAPLADTSVALANGFLYFACLDGRLYVIADI